MSDLIKREDAINAAVKAMDKHCNGYNSFRDMRIRKAIEALPSADRPQDDDWEKYSDKLWKNAYERGKADGAMIYGNEHNCIMTIFGECSYAETGCGDCAVVEKVRKALSADRPQGEWIRHFDDIWPEESTIECSECHEEQPMGIDENFCPHCGTRMIRQLDAKIVANGNCALCGKPLSDGRLFVCKECQEHIEEGAGNE